MITNKDMNEEISVIENHVKEGMTQKQYEIDMLKLACLNLKLNMSMRTNQTLMMDKMGVKRIEPQRRDDEKKQ
jgi:hypothetical protein